MDVVVVGVVCLFCFGITIVASSMLPCLFLVGLPSVQSGRGRPLWRGGLWFAQFHVVVIVGYLLAIATTIQGFVIIRRRIGTPPPRVAAAAATLTTTCSTPHNHLLHRRLHLIDRFGNGHGPNRGGTAKDIGKIDGIGFVKIEPVLDASVHGKNFARRPEGHDKARRGGFPPQQQPNAEQDATDGQGQTDGKRFEHGGAFFVQPLRGRHHGTVGSSQGQSGPEHAERRGMRHDNHIGTKGTDNDGVINAPQGSGQPLQIGGPRGIVGRIEFDKHGNVETGQDGGLRPDRHEIGMMQGEFLFLERRRLLFQGGLELEFVGGQHDEGW
mmetsp:Transcript_24913/g.57237  ORF Transcript_24913/g.57237 Transcript_24913/m.57237 type:complete len:326 (+) Transcript_24913:1-978(+)